MQWTEVRLAVFFLLFAVPAPQSALTVSLCKLSYVVYYHRVGKEERLHESKKLMQR